MADQYRPDDLAPIYARLAAQDAAIAAQRTRIARLKRSRRLPRRALPLILAALLVALVPFATLAATPFGDLTGGPHDGNIDAIYNAGITKGCDATSYCPTGNVTREEMASFLARTAGLGGNPPIANAATAVNATNAQNAVSAQNAAALGGQPPGAFLPAAGDTTYRYPGATALNTFNATVAATNLGGATITVPAGAVGYVIVPLPRATAEHGRFLAVRSLRVCYRANSSTRIDSTYLYANERRTVDLTTLIQDITPRDSTADTCYDVAAPTPRAVAGMTYAYLAIRNTGTVPGILTLDSLALTVTPLAAGAAEAPGDGSSGPDKPQP